MATYFARKAGNVNAADVWATTPSGTASNFFPTLTNADVLVSNSFTVTLNVNTTVAEVRNDATGGATAGGFFDLSSGVTLTANIIAGSTNLAQCVRFNTTGSAAIVGNCTAGTGGQQHHAVLNSSSGTLTITGNVIGGSLGCVGAANSSSGVLNITGNVTGSSGGINGGIPSAGCRNGLSNASSGIINITGNVTGGSVAGSTGADNPYTGTINVFGIATGGTNSAGANNASTGQINITRARGNAYGPGNTSGLSSVVGASNAGLGVIEIQELEYGTFGQSPTSGAGIRLKKLGSNVAVFNYCDTAGAKTLIDATQNAAMPAEENVRSGVSYASGALTGTCAVPAAGSVASGVPVDSGFGTAVLTAADVQSALTAQGLTTARAGALDNLDATVSSRLAPNGTLATVTTLTNAPDVPTEGEIASAVWSAASREITGGTVDTLTNAPASVTPSDIWSHATRTITGGTVDTLTNAPTVPSAAAIRAEIDSNSTQLAAIKSKTDNLPASPAATGDIPSANISAIKAKTDLLETTRLAQCSTVATTGAQLAAALS